VPIYKFIVYNKTNDPRNGGYLKDAHTLGFHHLHSITVQDLYFIEGQLSQEISQQLALKLLSDPVTQSASWIELSSERSPLSPPEDDSVILEVALRPGVTDPVAEQFVRAAHELNLLGVHRAATGQRFILCFDENTARTFTLQ
jgi:phosphoribosylformylglycinamidine (FGAM) synthase PurS component